MTCIFFFAGVELAGRAPAAQPRVDQERFSLEGRFKVARGLDTKPPSGLLTQSSPTLMFNLSSSHGFSPSFSPKLTNLPVSLKFVVDFLTDVIFFPFLVGPILPLSNFFLPPLTASALTLLPPPWDDGTADL